MSETRLDEVERFSFVAAPSRVLGWVQYSLVNWWGYALLQLLFAWYKLPDTEPFEPVVLECSVQPEACEARLPSWFPSPEPRHPDAMMAPMSVRYRAAMGNRTPAELHEVRLDLFEDLEDRQAFRHVVWTYEDQSWNQFQMWKWLSGTSWLTVVPVFFIWRRRRSGDRTAVVHRHRVELGDDVVYFADLAEGDASILCHTFVDGRDGDYEGFRRAVLERIPAGRATTEASPADRRALEGLQD